MKGTRGTEIRAKPKLVGQFGLGCIQFRPKKAEHDLKNIDQYVHSLRQSLENISAAQDVKVFFENPFGNFTDGIPTPMPQLEDDEYPAITEQSGMTLDISMRLRIPDRAQRSLMEIPDSIVEWDSFGDLDLHVLHLFYCPILVVFLTEPNPNLSPSTAVRLVRLFLKKELDANSEADFTLDFLGPSPFHVDFEIYEGRNTGKKGSFEYEEALGYDTIKYIFSKSAPAPADYVDHFRYGLLSDASLFYMIVLRRNQVVDLWLDCLNSVREFENRRRTMGLFERIRTAVVPSSEIDEIVSGIANFRLEVEEINSSNRSAINDQPFVKEGSIWKLIDKELKEFPNYNVESLEKLVEFIDRRQTNAQKIVNALIAAVLGAVAGGLASWLFAPAPH